MRQMTIYTAELVLCRSDRGDGGWSLHAPGSTDEDIADGEAPYLVSGPDREGPTPRDYCAAAEQLAPWAAQILACEGGYIAFESTSDADQWQRQT